jgi:hypothetical protein
MGQQSKQIFQKRSVKFTHNFAQQKKLHKRHNKEGSVVTMFIAKRSC